MPFSHILGQDGAVGTLTAALRRGRVHHAYRFEGPDGVGKELAAFALAQALLCSAGDPLGCGACDACRRAVTLATERPQTPLHPDFALLGRDLYPPETIGKKSPEVTGISIEQVRKIVLSHAAYAPHEGRARVFLVRSAEDLTPNAANALLKTLEEPRPGTHFILLSSRADRLLDTIRSRTLPVRFAPLPASILRGILDKHEVPRDRQELAIELSGGSASAALGLADAELTAGRDAFVESVLAAVAAPDLGAAVALAEGQERNKAELRTELYGLGAALARRVRADAADPARARAAALGARRYELVARAAASLDRNASPSLTMTALIHELREAVA